MLDPESFVTDEHLIVRLKDEERLKAKMKRKEELLNSQSAVSSTCPVGFIPCNSGDCLSSRMFCDGYLDCDDSSDELNCARPPTRDLKISGFKLDLNSSQEPLMLFSTGLEINGYWMSSGIYFDVFNQRANSRSTIVGVDMDPNNKEVELGKDPGVFSILIDDEQFESRHRRKLNQHKTLVDSGLLSPEDVALDMVGKNIYITDAGLPAIVVCSLKHSQCKVILTEGLHKPRAIIADSSTGWLTYTDWGDRPGIFLVSMDGKRRETLIAEDIVWPNGLAADYANNQLYWADARLSKIERIDLKTRKRRQVIKESATNPFSLSLFEKRIYWSDWSGSDIKTCDKIVGNDSKTIMHTDNIYGIHIYHPSLYNTGNGKSDQSNPCWSKHCSHLCLLSPTPSTFAKREVGAVGASCACPDMMELSTDKSSCYEKELSFLLISTRNYIAQVNPEQIGLHAVEKVIYSRDHIMTDLASDWLHFRLFFYDSAKSYFYSVNLADKNIKIERFMAATESVKGLLYDTWSDSLYWLDSERGTLSMGSVKGRFEKILRRDLVSPQSLVLDYGNRVFYIALSGDRAQIMRTDMFASKQADLPILVGDVGSPNCLHLDEQKQRLYWADSLYDTIESLDLDIKSHNGLVKRVSRKVYRKRLGQVVAFAVYHDFFVWTIKNGDYVYRAKIGTDSFATEPRPVSLKLPSGAEVGDTKRIIVVDPEAPVSSPNFSSQPVSIAVADALPWVEADHHNLDTKTDNSNQSYSESQKQKSEKLQETQGNKMVWLIVLLVLLSVTGLVTLTSLLILYKQGRLPRQLTVSFVSQNRDKDGAVLLLDNES